MKNFPLYLFSVTFLVTLIWGYFLVKSEAQEIDKNRVEQLQDVSPAEKPDILSDEALNHIINGGLDIEAQRILKLLERITVLEKQQQDILSMIGPLQYQVYGPRRYHSMRKYKSQIPPWWTPDQRQQFEQPPEDLKD